MIVAIVIAMAVLGLLIASLFVRRHRETDRPGLGWQRTEEIFNDPSTNRIMRVWLDAAGERRYVVDEDHPSV